MRILYLQTSPVPPPVDSGIDRFVLLSGRLEGEVLQPIWCREAEQVEKVFGPGSWPRYRRGKFQYRWLLSWRWTGLSRFLHTNWFYISEGLRAHREKPIDCVMTYSHMTTALCGIVIKVLTGARLVVEVFQFTRIACTSTNTRSGSGLRDSGAPVLFRYLSAHQHVGLRDCVQSAVCGGARPLSAPARHAQSGLPCEFVPVSVVPRHECAGDPHTFCWAFGALLGI